MLCTTLRIKKMIISKGPIIKCKKCNKKYEIEPDDFGEPETYSDERNMGYEIGYVWEMEFECDKCNNEISITIEGYEYPVGVYNYENFSTSGCNFIEEPALEIVYEKDNYDEYDS